MWGVLAYNTITTHTHTFTVVCLVNKTEAFSSLGGGGVFTGVSRATVFVLGVILDSFWSHFEKVSGNNLKITSSIVISWQILDVVLDKSWLSDLSVLFLLCFIHSYLIIVSVLLLFIIFHFFENILID